MCGWQAEQTECNTFGFDLIPITVTFSDDAQDEEPPERLRAEAAGRLSWAVTGCLEWQKKGLAEPDEVLAATREYRTDMDILSDFLGDCCVQAPDAQVTSADLNKAYEDWCEKNRHRPMSGRGLGLALKERGFVQERQGSKRVRTWQRLGLIVEDRWDG